MCRRLLLIEDDESMHEVLRALLESEGYEVIGAADGHEALDRLRGGAAPSLIVLDLMLPRMDGFEFRARQRANPAWADIPVVVYSGMDRLADRVRVLEPSAWFPKPVDPESLLGAIEKFCN
jgi:two-component system, chemotaxis family, chemotaxis protein CheY